MINPVASNVVPFSGSRFFPMIPIGKKETNLCSKYNINPDNIDILKPSDVNITKQEKAQIINKILEAHEQGIKNHNAGNITGAGYATNVCLQNGQWSGAATNFNNTRGNLSSMCGERSAVLLAYNKFLAALPDDQKENPPQDFKIKMLAMSSYKPLGTDPNAAKPCAECLSWINTSRYFSDDTLIASLQLNSQGKLDLVINKVSEYLPNRGVKIEPPSSSLIGMPVVMSDNAFISAKEKGISDATIRKQVKMTLIEYQKNDMADISGQNIAASVFANGELFTAKKIDFTKRWGLDPLEFAAGKAVEKFGKNTKADAICCIGDDVKMAHSIKTEADRAINLRTLGELEAYIANPKTLIITTDKNSIIVKTFGDYMPEKFKYSRLYSIPSYTIAHDVQMPKSNIDFDFTKTRPSGVIPESELQQTQESKYDNENGSNKYFTSKKVYNTNCPMSSRDKYYT